MKYRLVINLKTYEESLCKGALNIAKVCSSLKEVARKKSVEIVICPSVIDLKDCVREGVKVYSQHIDDYKVGAHTGFILPRAVKCAGACGTLLNHSEHRIKVDEIRENVDFLKELKLESCVCVENVREVKNISKFKPDFIAIEPKELIGGDISISTAKPELIENSVKSSDGVKILVGAGVKNADDVRRAIELGACGVLVASGVVKAKNVKKAVLDLLSGF